MAVLLVLIVLGLSLFALLAVASVVVFVKALGSSDSLSHQHLAGAVVFKCGVAGLAPGPIYTSYPMAKLLVAEDVLGVRTPALGDFVIDKRGPYTVASAGGLLGGTVTIRSDRRQLRVKVTRRDLPRVAEALSARNWDHQLKVTGGAARRRRRR